METKKAMELAEELMNPKKETEDVETKATAETEQKTETTETTEATATEVVAEPKTEPEVKAEEPKEPVHAETEPKAETAQPAETETKSDRKQSYTRQEKIDFAFKKEKAKRKAAEAKYQAVMAELEKLKKQQPNKENAVEYVDYAVDLKDKEREASRLQEQIRESQSLEYEELNNARIRECFPDEAEQEKFRQIVDKEGPRLLKKLDAEDPEQAVLAYLDDSPIAPILTRLMIAKPEYLDEVLSKRSPYGKYSAMEKLAERVEYARQQMAKPEEVPQPAAAAEAPKPVLPVVGSVTKSDANKDTPKHFDANAVLHKLNSKGGYRTH